MHFNRVTVCECPKQMRNSIEIVLFILNLTMIMVIVRFIWMIFLEIQCEKTLHWILIAPGYYTIITIIIPIIITTNINIMTTIIINKYILMLF